MTKQTKSATDIDLIIAQRLRAARLSAGISQEKVGEALGLTFQQIQKYERGTNRISAGKLVTLAKTVGVPVASLFAGIDEETEGSPASLATQMLATPYGPDVVRDYLAIKSNQDRSVVAQLVRALARG